MFNEDVKGIKFYVFNHFNSRFQESNFSRTRLEGVNFNRLNLEDKVMFEEPFTLFDIKDAIWHSASDKIRSLVGFKMGFYKATWDIIKMNFFNSINEFFQVGYLLKAIFTTFLALIPKKSNLQDLNNFRHICLMGSLYRIILFIVREVEVGHRQPHIEQEICFHFYP